MKTVIHATYERENSEKNAQALSEDSQNRQQPSLTRKTVHITNFAQTSFPSLATAQARFNVCIGVGLSTPSLFQVCKDFGLGMSVINNKTSQ